MGEGSGGVGVRISFPYKAEVVDSHNYFLKPKKASEESRREKGLPHIAQSQETKTHHTHGAKQLYLNLGLLLVRSKLKPNNGRTHGAITKDEMWTLRHFFDEHLPVVGERNRDRF